MGVNIKDCKIDKIDYKKDKLITYYEKPGATYKEMQKQFDSIFN